MKKREQQEERKRNRLRELAEDLLKKQIQRLSHGDCYHPSIEVEIARYIKDYVLDALVKGDFSRREKRFAGRVLKQYLGLFKFFDE